MAALATALLALTSLVGNTAAEPGTVALKFARSHPRTHSINKRDPTTVSVGNVEQFGLYYVNATIGTPGQVVQLQIDTGSSDVWMFGPEACQEAQCLGGNYTASQSSSYKLLNASAFEIHYVTPGSGVEGDYFSDDFALGSLKLQDLTMAVATAAKEVNTGIMGIGFDTDESVVSNGGSMYPSIIDQMVDQKIIESRSYSLWLDDQEADSGTILFGGYDSDKYHGELSVLDIQPDAQSGTISSFTVVWSLLALTDSTGTTAISASFPYPAVLDSGTTLMAVPQEIYDSISGYFGVTNSETYGAIVHCSYGDWKGTLDFGFGGPNGPIIQVPFSELAVPTTDENGEPLKFKNGSAACLFGLEATPQDGIFLLGDTFLRSAYVVYDMDAQQIGIAQTNYNSTKAAVQPIGSGTALASLVSSATYVSGASITQTATGLLQQPGNDFTGTDSGFDDSSTAVATGTLSHIAGQRTSLSLPSLSGVPAAVAATGASASGGSASSGTAAATSSGAAAGGLAPADNRGLLVSMAAVGVMMAGGAALFAQV